MLLLLNSGIFYELSKLIPSSVKTKAHFTKRCPDRGELCPYSLDQLPELWGIINMGDTVMFTSLSPYRIVVTGRIKHFISAFGEHVIAKEVEEALAQAVSKAGGEVSEFTVAPQVNPASGELPYHEWFIEFEKLPEDIDTFTNTLDQGLQAQNSYYKDLIEGKILQRLKITCVPKSTFVSI